MNVRILGIELVFECEKCGHTNTDGQTNTGCSGTIDDGDIFCCERCGTDHELNLEISLTKLEGD